MASRLNEVDELGQSKSVKRPFDRSNEEDFGEWEREPSPHRDYDPKSDHSNHAHPKGHLTRLALQREATGRKEEGA